MTDDIMKFVGLNINAVTAFHPMADTFDTKIEFTLNTIGNLLMEVLVLGSLGACFKKHFNHHHLAVMRPNFLKIFPSSIMSVLISLSGKNIFSISCLHDNHSLVCILTIASVSDKIKEIH